MPLYQNSPGSAVPSMGAAICSADLSNSFYTSSDIQIIGGDQKEWNDLYRTGQRLENINPLGGYYLGELEYVISKTNRLNCPLALNPAVSTFLDVALWAYYHKRLQVSTIEQRLRYARFMQSHSVPVDFSNPTYENFRYHMDYREEIEGASAHALKNSWKAMRMFLEAFGIPIWPYKPPSAPINKERNLPFPNTVRSFFYYDFSSDLYEKNLYQYVFYHSFMIGWRVPSELCEMSVNDITIDKDGTGSIVITETKKHRSRRTIVPEKYILSSQSHKSFKNWLDKWRPQVENQYSGDKLYLWPNGKPVTSTHLRLKLSEHGKKIWPSFKPYDTRHWCAVSRLIETKVISGIFEPYTVKNWLGHSDLRVTEAYIQHADQYFRSCPHSWIHHALRSHKHRRCEV